MQLIKRWASNPKPLNVALLVLEGVQYSVLANHHGHQLDLTTLRNRYRVSLKGANSQQLMHLANQLGLTPRALKLDLDDLKNLRTSCILHREMNHFVVLKKCIAGASSF